MIGDHTNPVLVKEMRSKSYGRARHLIRIFYSCLIFSIILAGVSCGTMGRWDPDAIRSIAVIAIALLIFLVGPGLTSGVISQEREEECYDLLRMTPLRSGTIMLGKIAFSFWHLTILLASTIPLFLTLLYLDYFHPWRLLISLALFISSMLLALSLGLFCSTVFKRTATSTAVSYGLISLLCVGTFLALFLQERLSPGIVYWTLALNPFVALIDATSSKAFVEFTFWKDSLVLLTALGLIFLSGAAFHFRRFERQEV